MDGGAVTQHSLKIDAVGYLSDNTRYHIVVAKHFKGTLIVVIHFFNAIEETDNTAFTCHTLSATDRRRQHF